MTSIDRYIIKELIGPFFVFLISITGIVWLTQALRLISYIVDEGQTATQYAVFTILVLPKILAFTIPIALFCSIIYILNKLQSDSELTILWSIGHTKRTLIKPILYFSSILAVFCCVLSIYLVPEGLKKTRLMIDEMRSHIGDKFLEEKSFKNPAKGLIVFVREMDENGNLKGLLIHDSKNKSRPKTYMAKTGKLIKTEQGPQLQMFDGNIQEVSDNNDISLLFFEKYNFDLAAFEEQAGGYYYPEERSLAELKEFIEQYKSQKQEIYSYGEFVTEYHKRLTSGLYIFAYAILGICILINNQNYLFKISRNNIFVSLLTLVFYLSNIILLTQSSKNITLIPILYVLPLVVVVFGYCLLDEPIANKLKSPLKQPN